MTHLNALVALIVANGAPLIGNKLLAGRFAWPIDGGTDFVDGKPVFGPAKTWRGIVLSITATMVLAPLLSMSWVTAMLMAVFAMIGDLISSFIKRRLGMTSGALALGLDQIPESLLPLLVCQDRLGLTVWDIAIVVLIFLALQIPVSHVLYKRRVRRQRS